VPVPQKLLSGIHKGLRTEILSLLTIEKALISSDAMSDTQTNKWLPVLKGKLANGDGCVSGSAVYSSSDVDMETGATVQFLWQGSREGDTVPPEVRWPAAPFVRLDGELKVSLLFRVDGLEDPEEESFVGEYHRFSAESEPVQQRTIRNREIRRWIPPIPPAPTPVQAVPQPDTMTTIPAPETTDGIIPLGGAPDDRETDIAQLPSDRLRTPDELRDMGERFFRDRQYPAAVQAFDALRRTGDESYNDVARLHHGSALWKIAERDIVDREEKIAAIREAIALLTEAGHHSDLKYRALSYYQLSKAQWHLWRHCREDASLLYDALNSARNAAKLDYDPTYLSWHDRLGKEEAKVRKVDQQ
jgi:hypothetical protein